jgi:hypothetical protein
MSDRAQLEAAYRAPYRAMRAAQDRSAEADAAQRRARDERREAEDRFEEAKLAVHCAIVDGRDE